VKKGKAQAAREDRIRRTKCRDRTAILMATLCFATVRTTPAIKALQALMDGKVRGRVVVRIV
jgi:hypothetical protein